jgi:hypothetical protein
MKAEMDGACGMHGKMENGYKFLMGRPQRREYLQDPVSDGRIMGYRVEMYQPDSIGSRQ